MRYEIGPDVRYFVVRIPHPEGDPWGRGPSVREGRVSDPPLRVRWRIGEILRSEAPQEDSVFRGLRSLLRKRFEKHPSEPPSGGPPPLEGEATSSAPSGHLPQRGRQEGGVASRMIRSVRRADTSIMHYVFCILHSCLTVILSCTDVDLQGEGSEGELFVGAVHRCELGGRVGVGV